MGPVAIAAICLGFQLASEIIEFISGEINDSDKRKLQEISNEISNFRADFSAVQNGFVNSANALQSEHEAWKEEALIHLQEEYEKQEQANEARRGIREAYRQERQIQADDEVHQEEERLDAEAKKQAESLLQKMVNYLTKCLGERIDFANSLSIEIKDTLAQLKQYKMEQCTAMRKNAFNLLEQELHNAYSKARAYLFYLQQYQKVLVSLCRENSDELVFSFQLPERFPYQGAIIPFSVEELELIRENEGWGELIFHEKIRISIYIESHRNNSTGYNQNMYVEEWGEYPRGNTQWKGYRLSSAMASYYLCKRSGNYTGLPVTVTGYDRDSKDALLSFEDELVLHLKPQNMLNSIHYPAIGSEIIVYPLFDIWNKKQNKKQFYVTQRFSDTEIPLFFHEIPVVIPPDKLIPFCEYFQSHNIDLEYDDARIAPLNEHTINGDYVKIQFQDEFLMIAIIKMNSSGIPYFEFESFPAASAGIHAEDIFVSFRATINMLEEKELNDLLDQEGSEAVSDEMSRLVMTVFREFRYQKEMKAAAHGSRYFEAWEQLTGRLKEYLSVSGESCTCTVSEFPIVQEKEKGDLKFRYVISEEEILRTFIQKQETLRETKGLPWPLYFVNWNGYQLNTFISPDCESITIILPDNLRNEKNVMALRELSHISFYKLEYCIPEQRQLTALYRFKNGNLANESMHLFALNGAAIHSDRLERCEIILKNDSLSSDASQYHALSAALQEKNWFMIQGPPGTGKTTVIRELIWQTLLQDPRAKILIVSQANVAVDNVLRGLLKAGLSSDIMIRCGRTDRIANDILTVSYEQKYKLYLDQVEKRATNGDKTALEWLSILDHSEHKKADIGLLLMTVHQIIGATCVGLAQKNIGLETLSFDLVIIDEAGKALLPEILIPLNKAKKLVLIGDHKQLPPVVHPALYDPEKIELDDRSYFKKEIFDTSFFERAFISCPEENKTILTTQYRMPQAIGTMISEVFYDGKIQNGVGTDSKKPMFYDTSISLIDMSEVKHYHEDETNSPTNEYEAYYVLHLIKEIQKKALDIRIAVITPYKGQKRKITNLLLNHLGNIQSYNIAVDTVDSFQGDEAEIVIYCTTRSKRPTSFYSDFRRLNVAFSRAKNELIILASVRYLEKYEDQQPIRKVLKYLQNLDFIRKPDRISIPKKKPVISCVIPMYLIVCESICNQEDIEKEIQMYQESGHFSITPEVIKKGDTYQAIQGKEAYYAAKLLDIDELIVSIHSS